MIQIPGSLDLFDAHCHLQDPRFEGDLGGVLARAAASGVRHMVCCGTREADWGAVLALSDCHASVAPMLGLHPWQVSEAQPGWGLRLRELAKDSRVGIGECGLDFVMEGCDREAQESAFRLQLRLARELDRPVAMHCRKAWERLIQVLREEGLPVAGGMVHAYSGSAETARELQALGCYLSFGGSITRPGNTRSPKALAAVEPHRLLIESDAPDLPPHGAVGLNEPANLTLVLNAAARLRDEDPAGLAHQTYSNAMMLFGGLVR